MAHAVVSRTLLVGLVPLVLLGLKVTTLTAWACSERSRGSNSLTGPVEIDKGFEAPSIVSAELLPAVPPESSGCGGGIGCLDVGLRPAVVFTIDGAYEGDLVGFGGRPTERFASAEWYVVGRDETGRLSVTIEGSLGINVFYVHGVTPDGLATEGRAINTCSDLGLNCRS